MNDYDDEINPGHEPLNSAKVAQIVASVPLERWFICYAETVGINSGRHQEFRNLVIEEDPITWVTRQNEMAFEERWPAHVLVSAFLLTCSNMQYLHIKEAINGK